jgi:hypothetical protein
LWGIAVELALIGLAVYTPAGHALLGTEPLAAEVWLLFVPLAAALLGLEEARKLVARRLAARRGGGRAGRGISGASAPAARPAPSGRP